MSLYVSKDEIKMQEQEQRVQEKSAHASPLSLNRWIIFGLEVNPTKMIAS